MIAFELTIIFLFETNCHVMVINCAKLFINAIMHDKADQVSLNPMHEVLMRTVTLSFVLAIWFLVFNTLFVPGAHLCQIISKSYHA